MPEHDLAQGSGCDRIPRRTDLVQGEGIANRTMFVSSRLDARLIRG
jgi:hypothetical protein